MPRYEFFGPHLQENILEDLGCSSTMRKAGNLPALRQQESGATLVSLLRHHSEEECIRPDSEVRYGFHQS